MREIISLPVWGKNSIKKRMVIFFLIATILPTLIIGVFSYCISVKVIEEKASKSSVKTLTLIKGNIEKQVKDLEEVADVIFVEESIKKAIGKNYDNKNKFNYQALSAIDFFDTFFSYSSISNYISSIVIIGDNGYKLSVGDKGNLISVELLKKSKLYNDARKADGKIVWENTHESWAETAQEKEYTITLARLIKDEKLNKGIGVAFISFKESVISDLYDSIELAPNSSIFIVDNMGKVISHNREELLTANLSNLEYIDNILKNKSGYLEAEEDGVKMLVTYCMSDKTGWKIVEKTPLSELVKESNVIKNVTLLLILLCIFIGCIFSWFVSELVTRPIRRLRNTMKIIEQGNLDVKADESRQDEIGELSHSFNYMVEEIRKLFEKIVKEQLAIKEIEYQNLLSQVNPHFLYNTLNSIKWMAIIQNSNSIKEMASALGGLLQKSIKGGNKLISIKEELDMVNDYIYIQMFRYKDKFSVEYDVDENVLNLCTSKFVLQPIIENSIFHGLEPKEGKGIIKIKIRCEQDMVKFSVYDDGVGMTSEDIEKVFKQDGSNKRGFSAIGIKNIDSRIKMIFGEQYGLEIVSKVKEFTEVTVTIPVINQ